MTNMRVLCATPELSPLIKTGGLADAVSGLGVALSDRGLDLRFLVPGYPQVLGALGVAASVVPLRFPWGGCGVVRRGSGPRGRPVYVLDAPELFCRDGHPYVGPDGRDWPDNHRRFAALGWAAARLAEGAADWWPDVIHGNDWHCGLASEYLERSGAGRRPSSVLTIHNLAFQGLFSPDVIGELGLDRRNFRPSGFEFHGRVSFLKAGVTASDAINTVSPTYARETQTPAFGCGLDGVLRHRAERYSGILNGIDRETWNPASSAHLEAPFDATDPSGKAVTRRALVSRFAMTVPPDRPLLAVVSRLTHQKGIDTLLDAWEALNRRDIGLMVVGQGDKWLEAELRAAAGQSNGRLAAFVGFTEALGHRVLAAADMVLVPSRFEPCGLTQIYGLRYGAIPIARRTGGLADTIVHAGSPHRPSETGTGFLYDGANAHDLVNAVDQALAWYEAPAAWAELRQRAMSARFGWGQSAGRYVDLYQNLGKWVAA